MNNIKGNKQSTDSHIPALELCLAGEGQPTYQDLGNNRIEVAEIIEMPYDINKDNIHKSRFLALQFVWWFELLEEALLENSVDQKDVKIRFISDWHLAYTIVLNSPSIEDAVRQIEDLHKLVSEEVKTKMRKASLSYDTDELVRKRKD